MHCFQWEFFSGGTSKERGDSSRMSQRLRPDRSQFTGLIAGQPSLNLGNTCSLSVQHVNFDNTSCQHNASINKEPERTIPSIHGTGDLDAFFQKI